MKKAALLLTVLALGALPAPAWSQASAEPSEQQLQQNAVTYLRVLVSGLESESLNQEIKNVLMGCIYGNSLRHITEQMDRSLQANPGIERTNPSQLVSVMARVCGYRPTGTQPPASGAQGR
jgi:hypothetical protein